MADIAQDIRTYLIADTAISTLVSSRVSLDFLPQGQQMPAVVMRVVDTQHNPTLATTATSFATTRLQVDSYATTRTEANSVSEKIRFRIQNKRGSFGDSTVNAISLDSGVAYEIDPAEAGTDQRRFVASQDYLVHHQTATS